MLHSRCWLVAAMLLAAPPTSAQEQGGDAGADTSPTAWSCTVETLLSGDECVFETEAAPVADPQKQAIENAQQAAGLAERACARASRRSVEPIPDPSVLATCKKGFVEKAMACGSDGSYPLLDSAGRFSPGARTCYFAMAEVLARARLMADATAQCCRCLVVNHCTKSGEQCNYKAASGQLAVTECLQNECADICRSFVPDPGHPEPPLPPPPVEAPVKKAAAESKLLIITPFPLR